jgi:hypothetical protein
MPARSAVVKSSAVLACCHMLIVAIMFVMIAPLTEGALMIIALAVMLGINSIPLFLAYTLVSNANNQGGAIYYLLFQFLFSCILLGIYTYEIFIAPTKDPQAGLIFAVLPIYYVSCMIIIAFAHYLVTLIRGNWR